MMNPKNRILVPLLVMLLMTLLVGGTAYQQSAGLARATSQSAYGISRLIILNNLRWGLQKMDMQLASEPEEAALTWQALQRQASVLTELQKHGARPESNLASAEMLPGPVAALRQIQHPTRANVKALMQNTLFAPDLEPVDQLKDLQQEAQRVTKMVTLCMIALGLLLTTITAYDLEKLFRALANSRDLNIRLQEEERRRIAQDLHDGVVQDLIDLKRDYTPHKVDGVLNNLRRVCHNLKPQVLEDLGLSAALEFLADDLKQAGIPTVRLTLDNPALDSLPKHYELPLFRVMQELCSNIKRHAQATEVFLSVAYHPLESSLLHAFVQDNGRGFLPHQAASGASMGLAGVRERIEQVGGRLSIQSGPGQGSRFQFSIPVQAHG